MKVLSIPSEIKVRIVWVEYLVCWGNDWLEEMGAAELQIQQSKN